MRGLALLGGAVLAVTLLGCTSTGGTAPDGSSAASAPASARSAPALHRVHDPGQVTGTLAGPCTYRDGGRLPDPKCTPGAYDPAVTQANLSTTICRSGYSGSVRPPSSQTSEFKYGEAYPAYGDPASEKTELDHLVSLELGGANDASNLWPETPPTPNPKDSVEAVLHSAVCSGKVKLAAAQRAIARNWITAEKMLGIGS